LTNRRRHDILSIEILLLKILLKNNVFKEYYEYIDIKYIKENTRELSFIYLVLIDLQNKFSKDISVEELQGAFYATYPDVDKTIYNMLFEQLYAANVSDEVANDIVQRMLAKKRALKISEVAFQVSQGFKTQEDLYALLHDQPPPVATTLPESDTDLELIVEPYNAIPVLCKHVSNL